MTRILLRIDPHNSEVYYNFSIYIVNRKKYDRIIFQKCKRNSDHCVIMQKFSSWKFETCHLCSKKTKIAVHRAEMNSIKKPKIFQSINFSKYFKSFQYSICISSNTKLKLEYCFLKLQNCHTVYLVDSAAVRFRRRLRRRFRHFPQNSPKTQQATLGQQLRLWRP